MRSQIMIKKLKSLIPDKVKILYKYIINYFFHYKNVVKNNFFITSNVNLNDFGNRVVLIFFVSKILSSGKQNKWFICRIW